MFAVAVFGGGEGCGEGADGGVGDTESLVMAVLNGEGSAGRVGLLRQLQRDAQSLALDRRNWIWNCLLLSTIACRDRCHVPPWPLGKTGMLRSNVVAPAVVRVAVMLLNGSLG